LMFWSSSCWAELPTQIEPLGIIAAAFLKAGCPSVCQANRVML